LTWKVLVADKEKASVVNCALGREPA
jgi:hypothetical protein